LLNLVEHNQMQYFIVNSISNESDSKSIIFSLLILCI